MKQIASSIYERLTAKQRVVACIEASARGDDREQQKLVRSCPKKTYFQTDLCFSDSMERLMGLAVAVEADMKESMLRFLFFKGVDPDASRSFLQDFANIREAWRITLTTAGIDRQSMALAGPPSSPVYELIGDLIPKPVEEEVEAFLAEMLDLLALGGHEANPGIL